jgi:hypothetical protein
LFFFCFVRVCLLKVVFVELGARICWCLCV